MAALNCRARLQYRADFALSVVGGVIFQATTLMFAVVLLEQFPSLGGWTLDQILLISSIRLLSHAVYALVFDNLMDVVYDIRDGRFDGYLLRPLPVLFQVLLREFKVNAVGDLGAAVTLFAAAQHELAFHWHWGQLFFLVLTITGAVLLEAAIQMIVATVAFRVFGAETVSLWVEDIITSFANYPLNIFPLLLRVVFTFVLPIAFLAYLPAAVILGRSHDVVFSPLLAFGAPALGVAGFLVARLMWSTSMRRYQSAGA